MFHQSGGGNCRPRRRTAFLADWFATYRRCRDLAVSALSAVPGLSVTPPEGALFLYLGCEGLIGWRWPYGRRISTSTDLAELLLEVGVVTVPGAEFYADLCLRLSTATSDALLTDGIARIAAVCATLMERPAERPKIWLISPAICVTATCPRH